MTNSEKNNNTAFSNNFTITVKNKQGKELNISAQHIQQLFYDLNPESFSELDCDLFEAQQQLIENFNKEAKYSQFMKINHILRCLHLFTLGIESDKKN